ncbi:MAG: DNA polymerase III subunit beta [Planctomycetota bacterium]|jgi:DNA polymerase-3 subunit beta
MKFTCSRQALSEALSLVGSIVPSRSTKPILQNIRFDGAAGNMIVLSATDLEVGVRYDLEVQDLQDPESVVLPANRLIGVIREAWGETITLNVTDCKADIITEGGKFHVLGEPAEDFPEIPELSEGEGITLLADDLAQSIQRTSFATAKEEARYALAGVNVVLENQQLDMVTTDTFRLALSSKPLRDDAGERKQAIVLAKGIQELMKLIQHEEVISIQVSDTQFFAKTSKATLVSRLIEGKFPQYENIMPTDLEKKVTVNRERFTQALRQAAQLSNEETHAVNLITSGSQLSIQAATSDGSKADVTIDAEVEGGDVSVTFNFMYLMDVCKVIAEDTISLQLRDRESPGRIDCKDYTYVVSPVCSRT